MGRQLIRDPRKLNCGYCGAELTDEELRLTAEAESMTVDEILDHPKLLKEIMCDKCADFPHKKDA